MVRVLPRVRSQQVILIVRIEMGKPRYINVPFWS
jgi:hypothetical protein